MKGSYSGSGSMRMLAARSPSSSAACVTRALAVMMARMSEWSRMNAVYAPYFTKHFPARSAMGATGLALGASVEIECIATLK